MSNYLDRFKPVRMTDALVELSNVAEAARFVSAISAMNATRLLNESAERAYQGLHVEACDEERASYEAYQNSVGRISDPEVLMDVADRSFRAHRVLEGIVLNGRGSWA